MLPSERGAIASKARLRSRSEEDLLNSFTEEYRSSLRRILLQDPVPGWVARNRQRSEGSACRSIRIE